MSNGVKFYKNPYRNSSSSNEEKSEPYVPNYKIMGIDEELLASNLENSSDFVKLQNQQEDDGSNPRLRKLSIRQETNEPNRQNIGGLVNVGNNMDYTWSGVDGEIFDDISSVVLDSNKEMIDNNDFVEVSDSIEKTTDTNKTNSFKEKLTEEFRQKSSSFNLLNEEDYILMIDDTVIAVGSVNDIEEQANLLVFGDHEICDGNPIPAENILVLKRVKINIGLFLG